MHKGSLNASCAYDGSMSVAYDVLIMAVSDGCLWRIGFFFSSRRRHTRLQGDWSSDVCSSDLRLPSLRPRRHSFRRWLEPTPLNESLRSAFENSLRKWHGRRLYAPFGQASAAASQIGRASCRERV